MCYTLTASFLIFIVSKFELIKEHTHTVRTLSLGIVKRKKTTHHCSLLFARSQSRRGHIRTANGFDFLNATEFRFQQQLYAE